MNSNSTTRRIIALTNEGRISPQRMKQALEVLEGREPAADSPQKFLTVRGLTEFLCVSRTQAWKMRRAGMPSYHIGNKLIFKPAEVEEWLRTQQGK